MVTVPSMGKIFAAFRLSWKAATPDDVTVGRHKIEKLRRVSQSSVFVPEKTDTNTAQQQLLQIRT